MPLKPCPANKIRDPKTGRCVLLSGKKGQTIKLQGFRKDQLVNKALDMGKRGSMQLSKEALISLILDKSAPRNFNQEMQLKRYSHITQPDGGATMTDLLDNDRDKMLNPKSKNDIKWIIKKLKIHTFKKEVALKGIENYITYWDNYGNLNQTRGHVFFYELYPTLNKGLGNEILKKYETNVKELAAANADIGSDLSYKEPQSQTWDQLSSSTESRIFNPTNKTVFKWIIKKMKLHTYKKKDALIVIDNYLSRWRDYGNLDRKKMIVLFNLLHPTLKEDVGDEILYRYGITFDEIDLTPATINSYLAAEPQSPTWD